MKIVSVTHAKNKMEAALRVVCLLVVATAVAGCALFSSHPRYQIYPTLSLAGRIDERSLARATNSFGATGCGWSVWHARFISKLDAMEANEWRPTSLCLEEVQTNLTGARGLTANDVGGWLPLAKHVFTNSFTLDGADYCYRGASNSIIAMARRADDEYPHLLTGAKEIKRLPGVSSHKLPWLVSGNPPVAVALTKWTTPEKKSGGDKVSKVVVADAFFEFPEKSEVCLPGLASSGSSVAAGHGDGAKKVDDKTEDSPAAGVDFETEQTLTLSLSTVLNSPSVLDRIEYVSTYIWIEAYPFPPDGDIVLEEEFWNRFLDLNQYRAQIVRTNAVENDMCRALDDMRVRLVDVATTVNPEMIDLGSLTRTERNKTTAAVNGTIGSSVIPGGSVNPSLTYENETGSSMIQRLQHELDQRSTYIDPRGHFLRITQRGMQSANLAGRFLETITLHIPAASERTPVLVPLTNGNYEVKWRSLPLYSRVDAFTFSVVVARQTTALKKTTKDSYRLPDPTDAAFVAGVTLPDRVTLWQHERSITPIIAKDVNKETATNRFALIQYYPASTNMSLAPLMIQGFSPEQRFSLLAKLREKCGTNSPNQVCFMLTNSVIERCQVEQGKIARAAYHNGCRISSKREDLYSDRYFR